jgi:hypothetical protein
VKFIKNILFVTVAMLVVWCVSSCGNTKNASNGLEGKIIYEISYPYEKSSVLMDLYPTEMTLLFDNSKIHSKIKSSYDILVTDIIVDSEQRIFVQLLKNMSKRIGMQLNEDETLAWYSKHPKYSFTKTEETITIAGYVCTKTIAKCISDSLPSMELYHTKGLGIEQSNWWTPYAEIDGFLMGYDIEQYGMCMRLRAKEVKFEVVDDSEFALPTNFEMVDAATMDQQMKAVVEEYTQ